MTGSLKKKWDCANQKLKHGYCEDYEVMFDDSSRILIMKSQMNKSG